MAAPSDLMFVLSLAIGLVVALGWRALAVRRYGPSFQGSWVVTVGMLMATSVAIGMFTYDWLFALLVLMGWALCYLAGWGVRSAFRLVRRETGQT